MKKATVYFYSLLIMVFIVILFFSVTQTVEQVKANPTGEVVIDEGTSYAYKVNEDSSGKIEQELDASFNQDSKYLYNFKKIAIHGYEEPYYLNNNRLTKTSYYGTTRVNSTTQGISIGAYAWATEFAGTAFVKVDNNRVPEMNSEGTNLVAVRSSTQAGNPATSAHTSIYPNIRKLDDNTFQLLSGGYIIPTINGTKFDSSFNVTQQTTNLNITGIRSNEALLNGFMLDGEVYYSNAYLSSLKGTNLKYLYAQSIDYETSSVKKTLQLEAPDVSGLWTKNFEAWLNFGGRDLIQTAMQTADGGIIGPVWLGGGAGTYATDTGTSIVCKWDKDGNLEYSLPPFSSIWPETTFDSVLGLSDDSYYYYWERGDYKESSKLMRVNLNDPGTIDSNKKIVPEVVKTLPKNSAVQMSLESDTNTYFFYGYIREATDEMKQFGVTTGGLFIGQMDKEFNILNIQGLEADGYTVFKEFNFDPENPKEIDVGGDTRATNFLDAEYQALYNGKSYTPFYQAAFWGKMEAFKNYSPGIKATGPLTVNKENYSDDDSYDQALLEGISVTDVYDLDSGKNGGNKSQEWLNNRINRNPNNLDAPIDWTALGLNKKKVGPYLTKYFVTDSTFLQSSTSRLINIIDEQTVKDEVYAFHAENFDLSIDQVASLDETTVKKKSDKLFWNLVDGTIVTDESKTKLNQSELETIQAAQAKYEALRASAISEGKDPDFEVDYSDVLKPYPLTLVSEYVDSLGKTVELSRKITVFVTGTTTQVDKENNLILYSDNFMYPLKKAKNITDEMMVSLSHSMAFAYNHQWGEAQTSAKKLADSGFSTNRTDSYQSGENEKYSGLTNAKKVMDYVVKYTYTNGSNVGTNGLAQVRLYNTDVTLNIRQIVEDSNDKTVIPINSYIMLYNIDDTITPAAKGSTFNTNIPSGEEAVEAGIMYKKVVLPMDYGSTFQKYLIQRKELVPEYYEESGYRLSTTSTLPTAKETGDVLIDYSGEAEEYWLTLYVKPTTSIPSFYGWNYGDSNKYTVEQP